MCHTQESNPPAWGTDWNYTVAVPLGHRPSAAASARIVFIPVYLIYVLQYSSCTDGAFFICSFVHIEYHSTLVVQ